MGDMGQDYSSYNTIDPEELFHKIFGNMRNNKGFDFSDPEFSPNQFGYGRTREVIIGLKLLYGRCVYFRAYI